MQAHAEVPNSYIRCAVHITVLYWTRNNTGVGGHVGCNKYLLRWFEVRNNTGGGGHRNHLLRVTCFVRLLLACKHDTLHGVGFRNGRGFIGVS